MLLTYLNRSVSTKLAVWKFCFCSQLSQNRIMICFGTHNDHLMSFHVNASLNSFQSLMKKSPRLWALQLLPLLKLKVVVACNGSGDWRSGVCLFSFVPNLLFSVLSDSFISPAACSKHSQADPTLLLLAGTVAPPEMILPGGGCPDKTTKQVDVDVYSFTWQF